MQGLTPRQTEVLEWIRSYIAMHSYPPTRQEIANGMGFKSANAAHEHLLALEKKRAIRVTPGTSRGIVIVQAEQPKTPQAPVARRWPFPTEAKSAP